MKRHTETFTKLFLILLLTTLVTISAVAQDPPDEGMFVDPDVTPIDTGIVLMAVAGLGYGIKKLKSLKK